MVSKMENSITKSIFWGTSKCGEMNLSFWSTAGVRPDYFCSNDEKAWGTSIFGIPVISPRDVVLLKNYKIFITSYARNEIRKQLIDLGIDTKNIFSLIMPFYYPNQKIYKKLMSEFLPSVEIIKKKVTGVSFEYFEGGLLGGTQSWAYFEQKKLMNYGIPCNSLIPSDQIGLNIKEFNEVFLKRTNENNMFYEACDYFLSTNLDTFVSMSGSEMLSAACFVKKKYSLDLRIIAFCHADNDEYYDSYTMLHPYIDVCYVISNKMKNTFILRGFDKNKIKYYPWLVTDLRDINSITVNLNAPLRIGYLGRICCQQKRCDLLILLAEKLIALGVSFLFFIVGDGNYLVQLKNKVEERKLDKNIIFLGQIEHSLVSEFWDKQDIYVSCSEFEGHSLSQFEALSRGTVAVCTDCSGVSDDVINGYNGYVSPIGDIDSMASNIKILDDNRNLLFLMKQRTLKFFEKKLSEYKDPLFDYVTDNDQ